MANNPPSPLVVCLSRNDSKRPWDVVILSVDEYSEYRQRKLKDARIAGIDESESSEGKNTFGGEHRPVIRNTEGEFSLEAFNLKDGSQNTQSKEKDSETSESDVPPLGSPIRFEIMHIPDNWRGTSSFNTVARFKVTEIEEGPCSFDGKTLSIPKVHFNDSRSDVPEHAPALVQAAAARLYLISHIRHLRRWICEATKPKPTDPKKDKKATCIDTLNDWLAGISTKLNSSYETGLLASVVAGSFSWLGLGGLLTQEVVSLRNLLLVAMQIILTSLGVFLWRKIQNAPTDATKNPNANWPILPMAVAGGTGGLTILWLLWPQISFGQPTPNSLDFVLLTYLLVSAALLLISIGAPQSKKNKDRLKEYQEKQEVLDKALLSMSHANALVAMGCIQSGDSTLHIAVPEHFSRSLDEALNIKATVVSFESVIRAHLTYERKQIADIRENKARGQRAAYSAASGMAAGFITYSIGESVMQYLDMPTANDTELQKFLLMVKTSPSLNPDAKLGTPATDKLASSRDCEMVQKNGNPILPKLPLPTGMEKDWLHVPEGTPQCALLQQVVEYQTATHQDMLEDYGLLLVITFVSAMVAAWAAVKRQQPIE